MDRQFTFRCQFAITDHLCAHSISDGWTGCGVSDLWPPKLRKRRSKGLFNRPWQEALRPLASVLIKSKDLHVVRHGLVDRANVLSRLQRLSTGLDCNEGQLRNIVVLELWLRNRLDGGPFGQALRAAKQTTL